MPSIARATVNTVTPTDITPKEDFLAIEEPLEIRLEYGPEQPRSTRPLSVTMRTPGEDEDLVRGFLLTEGIVQSPADILSVSTLSENVVLARLSPAAQFDMQRLDRHFYTTSSCGVCGKTSIDAVMAGGHCKSRAPRKINIDKEVIYSLPETLRRQQSAFDQTGGIHASALFDINGNLLALREDVGRHNALDKLIGHISSENATLFEESVLLLSGRASFELLQKAAVAGIPLVCAVGAPSSLAVETARAFGITLIGFLRGERFNMYTD